MDLRIVLRNIKKDPRIIIYYLSCFVCSRFFSDDEAYIKLLYRARFGGQRLNLENPQTFNEKLQWLKLYDRKPEYTQMVDKYEAKKFIAEIIGEEYIVPTLGVWDKFEDIDFNSLPKQFVLKCTHDSGGVYICKDKEKLDNKAVQKKIKKSLARNYYLKAREWPYKDVKPRIIAEQYLYDNDFPDRAIDNFKLFCMDGQCAFFYIARGGGHNHNTTFTYFDNNKKRLPLKNFTYPPEKDELTVPGEIDIMFQMANKLSKGIPFLRVDFYLVNSHIYVGELTFCPAAGFSPFDPPEYNKIIGDRITLPLE